METLSALAEISDQDIRDLDGRCDAFDSRLKEIEKSSDTTYMLREENTYLRTKVEDLEPYIRKDSLLFEGLTENKNENCEDLLHMIFIKTLIIQENKD